MAKRDDNVVMGASEVSTGKKGHNIFPKIISVLLAFMLWFYVMTVESPTNRETFSGIPVDIVLSPNSDLTVYSGQGVEIEVTVSGKKSELNQFSAEDFKATVDARKYTQPGKYSIPVDITVPGAATVVEYPGELSVYLDVKELKEVPVRVKLVNYFLDEGLSFDENEITKTPSMIPVRGPKSVLDSIEAAEVEIDCGGKVSSSISWAGKIELLDSNGNTVDNPYISADVTNVDVYIPVFATKEIALKVDFLNGLLDSSNSSVTLDPPTVKVKGTIGALKSFDEYVIHTIDEKKLTSDKLSIPLTLPEGITAVGGENTVEVEINHRGTSTKTLSVKGINVNNPKGLSYELAKDNVTLTLRGDAEDLDKITAEDVTLSVDLSSQNAGVGSISLPIEIKLPGAYSGSVYEIGEKDQYIVSVIIK